MKKKVVAVVLAVSMMSISAFAGGCGSSTISSGDDVSTETSQGKEQAASSQEESTSAQNSDGSSADNGAQESGKDQDGEQAKSDSESTKDTGAESDSGSEDGGSDGIELSADSLLGTKEVIYYDEDLVPCVKPYTVSEDFSDVYVPNRFKFTFALDEDSDYENGIELRKALAKNLFAVQGGYGDSEFFDIYEGNRYSQFPSFVTVDSLMHTYHLYFAYLMKTTEKEYISEELKSLSRKMLEESKNQYKQLMGSDWEKAALRNLAFFYIGSILQDDTVDYPVTDSSFAEIVSSEMKKIMAAEGIDTCAISGEYEDYSQYKPRGYYEGDEELEKYFRAMMWYGRIPYSTDAEETVKSAILMNLAIDRAGKESWEAIYKITAFFAGKSDDAGYPDFMPLISECYGKVPAEADLTGDSGALKSFMASVSSIRGPKVNSIPVEDGDDPVKPSFRFMGQRFTIDAAIMQRLVYSAVKDNGAGEKRFLPDTLDVAATLGSEDAMKILDESGATGFEGYIDNMTLLKEIYTADDPALWNASLYSGWLNTLRPMFEKKGEGYPSFMQSDEWSKKNLETFAGSYAELKHDTILYAKQVMAEMGDGDDGEIIDDRGYVQPEPVVYSRFIFLSDTTRDGLKSYGMLSDDAEKDLDRLSEIGRRLLTISEKELKEETLSDEEYDFIREYGGDLEHFWREAMDNGVEDLAYSYQAPCPVIADIATDPNGTVLEVGTGPANNIYVIFPIDGELHVGRGSVYSFYQFETDISDRLTDAEWRERLEGGHLNENWEWVENENKPVQPDWTQSYRIGNR